MAGHIRKLGHRRYQARFPTGPRGRFVSRTFARKIDADAWLAEQNRLRDRGAWLDPKASEVRFREWSDAWLSSRHVSERTQYDYRELLDSRILPTFGDVELRAITPEMVRRWVAGMVDDGLSAARITKARHLLRSALRQAVVDGSLLRDATTGVKVPKARSREQRFLTATQVEILAAAAEDRRAGAGCLVGVLAYVGLRWGEAAALRGAAVDLGRRRIVVREAISEVGGALVVGPPKSGEARTVTMPTHLAREVAPRIDDTKALVFPSTTGAYLRSSNWRNRVWIPALDEAGIEPLRIHDLRHTAASLMIASGASIKVVQRQLGHATAAMTLDLYGHLYDDDLDRLADALDETHERAMKHLRSTQHDDERWAASG